MCVYVCMYVYIYIFINMYTYICIELINDGWWCCLMISWGLYYSNTPNLREIITVHELGDPINRRVGRDFNQCSLVWLEHMPSLLPSLHTNIGHLHKRCAGTPLKPWPLSERFYCQPDFPIVPSAPNIFLGSLNGRIVVPYVPPALKLVNIS